MCGVAGVFAYRDASQPVDPDELVRIREQMHSRGPDAAGLWLSIDGRVGLAHRRLSIIDLDVRSNQPMASEDGRLVISFNGEIYNHGELRQRLESQGCRFRTQSDTEVLLHLYRLKGDGMFGELRGMFAFALWDADRGAMLLARDPYGIKPLYYADDGVVCRAASQVKALLAGGRVSSKRSLAGMAGFYLLGSVPEPHTWFESIRAVPAGSYVWITRAGVGDPVQHFSVAQTWEVKSDAVGDVQTAARDALVRSVRDHLVSDVPVGIFLSSGVDSGSVLSLACEAGQRDIHAITLGFEEFKGRREDEVPVASEVAQLYGARHTVRRVSEHEFRDDLPQILQAMDQPTIDGINTWFVSKAAREAGLKVALSGLGGDELFGGYPSFNEVPRWVRTFGLSGRIPGLGRTARRFALALAGSDPAFSPKFAGLPELGGTYGGAYLLKRGLFMPWELPALMGKHAARDGLRQLDLVKRLEAALPRDSTPYAKVSTLEASFYMRNQLLRDSDWAGMAHSLEIRTPLVDASLLRALSRLVEKSGGRLTKRLLLESPSKPLPERLLHRAKTGFETPIGKWLHGVKSSNPSPLAPIRKASHWSRQWARRISDSDVFAETQAATKSRGQTKRIAIKLETLDKAPLRVLIFRIGSLGDTLVAIPTLKLIEKAFPNAERRLLSNTPNSSLEIPAWSVLEGTGLIHDYISYPTPASLPQLYQLWRSLREWQPDVIVYLAPRRKRLAVIRDRLFFGSLGARRIVEGESSHNSHVNLRDEKTGLHEKEAARLLRNASALGSVDLEDPRVWSLDLQDDDYAALSNRFPKWDWEQPFIVVAAGTKMQAKDWGEDRWCELISALTGRIGGRGLVAIGLEEERERSEHLLERWKGPVLNLCGQLAPRLSATVIAKADFFVGHDSGPMHMAGSANVPLVAIFSHRDQKGVWFPPGHRQEVLIKDVPCQGCMLQECIQHQKQCIRSITVAEAETACYRVLGLQ